MPCLRFVLVAAAGLAACGTSPPPGAADAAPITDAHADRDAGPDGGAARGLGASCSNHADCAAGHCAHVNGSTICTADCSAGGACAEGACYVPGDIVGYCVPDCDPQGGGCGAGRECRLDGRCVPTVCPAEAPAGGSPGCCYDDYDCNSGFLCLGARCEDDGVGQCMPIPDAGLGCWSDADCAPPRHASVGHCGGAHVIQFTCTQQVNDVGSPGTCVFP